MLAIGANSTAGPTPAAIRQAAEKFEAMALSQLLAPAFAAADPSKGPFGGGQAEAQWRPMLLDAYAERAVKAGKGLGLVEPVMREMLRLQAARTEEGGR